MFDNLKEWSGNNTVKTIQYRGFAAEPWKLQMGGFTKEWAKGSLIRDDPKSPFATWQDYTPHKNGQSVTQLMFSTLVPKYQCKSLVAPFGIFSEYD